MLNKDLLNRSACQFILGLGASLRGCIREFEGCIQVEDGAPPKGSEELFVESNVEGLWKMRQGKSARL